MQHVMCPLVFVASLALTLAGSTVGGAKTRSPVEKVVTLLKELEDRIKTDLKDDQQTYDKYACWCETTTHRKAEAIEQAKTDLRSLGQEILTQKGVVATRTAEIAELMEKIKENEEAQQEATTIRTKENAAFMAESAEMKQAIGALEKAITVLGDATLLQLRSRAGVHEQAASRVQDAISAMPLSAAAKMPVEKLSLLRRLTTDLSRAKSTTGYAPQSATIQGILRDMYDTFSEDLQMSTKTEAEKNRDFEDYIAEKQEELLTMQEEMRKKEAEKAEAEVMLAEATQSYDDTEAQLKADIEFFDATKEACTAKSEEWKVRKEAHEEELEAIANGLEILTSDEAREMFGKAFQPGVAPGFLQLAAVRRHSQGKTDAVDMTAPNKAYDALKKQARKVHSLRLARLAAEVRLAKVGHFDAVIEAIDKLLVVLEEEQQEDIKKRDQCKDEYQDIASTIADLEWKIENNKAKIEKLEKLIEEAEEEKAKALEQIAEVEKQMEEMTKVREEENAKFLEAKANDEDAIKILNEAKDALAAWYEKRSEEVKLGLLQQGPEFAVSEDQAPDAKFTEHGHRAGEAKGIVALVENLVAELETEIANAIKAEEESQLEYEKQMEAAKALKESLEEKVTTLEGFIADREADKLAEEEDLANNESLLEDEEKYKKEITPDCDWIIGAFETRAEKRTAEKEGLTEAKAFLAGYQPPAEASALQKGSSPPVDGAPLLRIDFAHMTPR